ncbi:MAG: VCBS repeat-containing protein [Pseudomonadota bacterium]
MAKFRLATAVFLTTAVFCWGCNAQEVADFADGVEITNLLLSDGDKTFLARDVNTDGRIDLVVAEEAENQIVMLLNDGEGGFNEAAYYPAGDEPASVTALDLNGDGNIDLAIANHESDSITLLAGDGAGRFTSAEHSPVAIVTEPHSHMIKAKDFNNDGSTDLIVDSRDRLGVYILSGQPGGSFNAPGQGIDVGGAPYLGFAVGDINNDAAPDLVTPNNDSISILMNRSAGKIAFEHVASIPIDAPFAAALGDTNGDSWTDLIVASERQNSGVTVLVGNGQGDFNKSTSFPMAAGAKTIATGDANGDGLLDAVITSWNADILLIFGGDTVSPQKLPIGEIENPWSAAFGDFDGDGRDEIVVGDASNGLVNIYSLDMANSRQ